VKATTVSVLINSPYKRHLIEEKDMKEESDRP